jgi:hypothetical protein
MRRYDIGNSGLSTALRKETAENKPTALHDHKVPNLRVSDMNCKTEIQARYNRGELQHTGFISGSHSNHYEQLRPLGHNAVQSGEIQ